MRSNEERIRLMHERAGEIRHRRKRVVLAVCEAVNLCLCVALIGVIMAVSGQDAAGYADNPYVGASLLDASLAGGYILTALIAFMAGVITTVIIRKYRDEKTVPENSEE